MKLNAKTVFTVFLGLPGRTAIRWTGTLTFAFGVIYVTADPGIRTQNLSFTKELNQYAEKPENLYIRRLFCTSTAFASVRI